jgi:hypothetical protein
MDFAEDVKEPPRSDWLELANGGGVMFRDRAKLPLQPPIPYMRRRKQLHDADDSVEP